MHPSSVHVRARNPLGYATSVRAVKKNSVLDRAPVLLVHLYPLPKDILDISNDGTCCTTWRSTAFSREAGPSVAGFFRYASR